MSARAPIADRLPRLRFPEEGREHDLREELRGGTTGVELQAGGVAARVGALPLVRRDGLQAIRAALRLDQPGRVTVRVGGVEATVDAAAGRSRVLLFVPRAESPTSVPVELHAGGASATAAVELRPPRRWQVHLIHHSHLDVGYTDPQAVVLDNHLRYIDAVLDLVAATDDWPEPARFRWNVEANLPLERWMRVRSAAALAELLDRVRAGRIEVCALPYSMHTEAYSIDELARTLRFARELRREHGVDVVTAMQTDVPGAAPGLATLLASAGVRYLAVAHNHAGRATPAAYGGDRLGRAFWWRAANGSRVLVWHTETPYGAYMEGNYLGLAESADIAEELLPEYLAALAERGYPYAGPVAWSGSNGRVTAPYGHDLLHLRVQGALGDNAPPSRAPAEVVRAWNERWDAPELRLATNREFFGRVETQLGATLPEWEGDWADWWADGLGSAARAVGRNRGAQAAIRSAQTVSVLADVLGGDQPGWEVEVDRAYEAMALFDEHTWGSGNPWADALEGFDSGALQWDRKLAFGHEAHELALGTLAAGAERLGDAFARGRGALASVLVVNPSGYARTDLVRVFLPASRVAEPCAVRAPDGREEPCVLEPQPHARFRAAGSWLSFVARAVPACGWARYDLHPASLRVEKEQANELVLDDGVLHVELALQDGTVASLVDRASGRELVDGTSAFGFNGYLYDRYGTGTRANHLSGRVPEAGPWLLAGRSLARDGAVVERTTNAVWDELRVRLAGEGCAWLETTYRLVGGLGRLEIENRVAKIATHAKESVCFTFPFAAGDLPVELEVTGGVAGPAQRAVPGSARHMRAIRHWALVPGSAAWASLEAPLVQLGNVFLPYRPFPPTVPPAETGAGLLVSWAMNNVWDTNFPPAQGGETVFRYAVSPAGERAGAIALSASLTAPLVGVVVSGRGTEDRATGSLLAVDDPEIELVHLARSELGLVAHIHSHAPEPATVGSVRIAPGDLLTVELEALQ